MSWASKSIIDLVINIILQKLHFFMHCFNIVFKKIGEKCCGGAVGYLAA